MMAISRPHPPLSVIIRHAQRPWAQARKPLGWPICPPARRRSFPVLARAIPRQTGVSVTIVHACIAALHGLQINCATLKWLPSAGISA